MAPSNQPVIGILMGTVIGKYIGAYGQYKLLKSYQSFIEQGGGGVVPIFINQPDEYYDTLIPRLNGVLLPGGREHLVTSNYGKAAYKIYQMATKMNDAGIHFPIWATCLGMQVMSTWPLDPRKGLLEKTDDTDNISLPLEFTSEAQNSKMFGNLPVDLREILSTENVTPHLHHYSLLTKTYKENEQLNQYFSLVSTNTDSNGLSFVSSLEARSYPFYGVQWHPERNNFFHPPGSNINQSHHAVLISQYYGNFIVEQAKLNTNTFKSLQEECRFLLNNYPSHFDGFVEYYVLSETDVLKFDD